jgi:acetamidase/formamidase
VSLYPARFHPTFPLSVPFQRWDHHLGKVLTKAPLIVPFAAAITPGETVKIECLDWTGGQIKNDDSADDVKNIDLTRVHYLSGPFEIKGAEPGDVLQVEIQDVQPFDHRPWGFCAIFDKKNGGGFLDEEYPQAAKGEFFDSRSDILARDE